MDQDTKQFIIEQLSGFRQDIVTELRQEFNSQITDLRGEMNRKFTELREELNDDMDRKVGVLVEHHSDEMQTVIEQYEAVRATQEDHTRILEANQETLLDHDEQLKDIKQHLQIIDNKLDNKVDQAEFDERVSTLEKAH